MNIDSANTYIGSFARVIGAPAQDLNKAVPPRGQKLKTGIDLGTANICVAILDENNTPLTGEIYPASAVKDGLVLDYFGAVRIVRELKERAERRLGVTLETAAAAIPPGTIGKNAEAISNVIRSADIDVINVVDEPTAAARALGMLDGAVVDIGGGTTGISILRGGRVIATHDEPTGGSHMTLVIAGNQRIATTEAELIKIDKRNHPAIFPLIRPVAEKMARIVNGFIKDFDVNEICLVGGAASFDSLGKVFEDECGIKTVKPEHCLLVTPLGIAMYCGREVTP